MRTSQVVFFLVIFLFTGLITISAQVFIDPVGVAVSTEAGDSIAVEVTLTNNGDSDVYFALDFDEPPDENNRNAGPRRDDRSDPDDAGYFWVDDDEDDGPEFNWIDIANREGAERLQAGDDWNSGVIDLGFEFPWYGEWYSSVRVCSNGWFTFDPEQDGTFNSLPEFPNDEAPNNILAVDCLDLSIGNQSALWFWTDGEGQAVISWLIMLLPMAPIRCDITMQAVLDAETGTVLFQYGNQIGLPANQVNVGYENQNGDLGASIYYHQAVAQGLAIAISGPFLTWFNIVPEEGVIRAEDSRTLDAIFMSEDMEAGTYEMVITIELHEVENEQIQSIIELSAVMTVNDPVFTINGRITDAATHESVVDAAVDVDRYIIRRFSDEDGVYALQDIPREEYNLTFTAVDHLPFTEQIEIIDEDVELNVELLHSECTPSQNQFFMELQPDMSYNFDFRIDNGGNGPLTYSVDRRLPGDANAEPFELRKTDEIQEAVDDDMLAGAIYADGQFFISGGNNGDDVDKIYILNMDREVVGQFDQFVEDRYGMRDLAYDGTLIWGAVEGTFYGFTTGGELVNSFTVDVNLEGRALAWDPENQVLLASDISTDIFAINRDGEVVVTYERPNELRIYGLGVWRDDPDGYYLYVFCRGPGDVGIDAFKLNPATGEYMLAAYFDVEGRPGGVQITNQLDAYSWVIVALVQNPDALSIWQLAARKEWFQINPTAGVIEPDEYEEFVLTLDAAGLPVDNDFRGEVVLMHDGVGSETVLDVTLSVVEGRVPTSRDINLHIGWNTVSTNLQPDNNEDIEGLVAAIVENGALIMMKNSNGDFYRPAYEFNNIDAWNSWDGFQILMASAATLTIEGESVLKEDPIDLTEGWQLVSYYPRYEIEATEALVSIVDHLIIAKDGNGNFYLPEWDDFSNMGNMCEGQGYFIKVDADCRLIYVPEEEERLMVKSPLVSRTSIPPIGVEGKPTCHEDQIWLSETPRSATSYSLLLLTEGMEAGTRLESYTPSGALAGRGVVDISGRCGMALWGNESGFSDGEAITITSAGSADILIGELEWLDGDISGWKTDGWGVAKLIGTTELPSEFGIVSAYPNPFNSQMRVSYNLLETGIVDLAAYDVSGRRVAELTSGRQISGAHTVMFDCKDMPSGVYMLRLKAGGQSSMMKVMLVK
ncbi:T9SS type A sorting domain-containing protein [bacterium]|nr:T9SS type A sorting domain-containing protein [bacterium]